MAVDILDLSNYELDTASATKLAQAVDALHPDVRNAKLYLLLMYLQVTLKAIRAQAPGPERDASARAVRSVVAYAEAHFTTTYGPTK